MTAAPQLNVGLIGLGFIGKMHANAYRAIPLCFPEPVVTANLDAVLRSKLDTEQDFMRSLGNPFATTDPDAFFNRKLDIVDVCSPNYLHFEQVSRAIERGMHVYCEKPLANNLAEARKLAEQARKAGVQTHVALIFRYLPAVRQMKAIIEAGELGEVFHFRTKMFHASYLDPNRPMSWRLKQATSGGGSLMDLGAHLVDLTRYLLGDVAWVKADMRTLITERPVAKGAAEKDVVDVDDWANCTLQMKSGAVGLVEVTRMAGGAGEETSFEVYGSKGALSFQMAQPDTVRFFNAKQGQWQQGAIHVPPTAERPIEKVYPNAKFSQGMMTNAHLASAYDFLQSVAEGRPSAVNFDTAAATQEVLEAAYRSAERYGELVELPVGK